MEPTADAQTPMRVTDVLVKTAARCIVGADLAEEGEEGVEPTTYVIGTFCFAKTVRAFALLTELAESAGVGRVVEAASDSGTAGEMDQPVAAGFVTQLVTLLPRALRQGVPAAHKLLGLIVTGNKALAALEDADGVDVDEEMGKLGLLISRVGSTSEIMNVISTGATQLGIEALVKNVMPLMRFLKK